MQQHHFLVTCKDGDYQLKRIDDCIGRGMAHFGVKHLTTDADDDRYTFYYLNCQPNSCPTVFVRRLTGEP